MNGDGRVSAVLAGWQSRIDRALARGLELALLSEPRPSSYHLSKSVEDLAQLSQGEDCCYDRPGIGVMYASWYQPRRVHEWVRRLNHALPEAPERLDIVDLGAGTGATLWAVALTIAAAREVGSQAPRNVSIAAVDASPDMLRTGEKLWSALVSEFPEVRKLDITASWHTMPWPEATTLETTPGCWVLAGHLFDASQALQPVESAAVLARTARGLRASQMWLSVPQSKAATLGATVEAGKSQGWSVTTEPRPSPSIWSGQLPEVGSWRAGLMTLTTVRPDWLGPPKWTCDANTTAVLHTDGPAGDELFARGPTGLALDLAQEEASTPTERMTLVVGAAGSGKSTVLVERIARLIERHERDRGALNILVTSFNTAMIDRLAEWHVDRTRDSVPAATTNLSEDGAHAFVHSDGPWSHSVRFLNWDKVPTRLFGVNTGVSSSAIDDQLRRMAARGEAAALAEHDSIANRDFLDAELRRVIYGKGATTIDVYLKIARSGRQKQLYEPGRRFAWRVLMEDPPCRTFAHRWLEVLDLIGAQLDADPPATVETALDDFTHVFIDECQDFTPMDFRIAAVLCPDANRISAFGDASQSMHLGSTFEVPGTLRRRRWLRHDLSTSYRLPARLAEAVAPLAAALASDATQHRSVSTDIDDDNGPAFGVPDSTVLGVLGHRPIVLAAGGTTTANIADILNNYIDVATSAHIVCHAEGASAPAFHTQLREALPSDWTAKKESMRAIKGLEREIVVWNTGAQWTSDEAATEFVYTVLTRTRRLVVVVVDPERTSDEVALALGHLRRDRLLYWDQRAEEAFRALVQVPADSTLSTADTGR